MKQEESIAARVRSYFESNPMEWLTGEDIAAKFELSERQLLNVISYLRKQGHLQSWHVYGRRQAES